MGILGILSRSSHAVITQMEHNSVLRPVHSNCKYTMVKADKFGRVLAEDIKKAIRPDTKMIIMTHASNVCGTIEPIEETAKIAMTLSITGHLVFSTLHTFDSPSAVMRLVDTGTVLSLW